MESCKYCRSNDESDAHAALLAKLGLPKVIVLGVSAGAPSAVELAVRHPDKVAALILIVTLFPRLCWTTTGLTGEYVPGTI
jgi:pimeloyl-ACP methyl ester carboxylesterase